MKKLSIIFGLMSLLMISCDSSKTDDIETVVPSIDTLGLLNKIKDIEIKLNGANPDRRDLKVAAILFEDYAKLFPGKMESAEYLLRASDYFLAIGQTEKSIELLDQIIHSYPEYSKLESAYFNRASHTDFEMRDTTKAKIYYQEFIDKYPNSELVDDAEIRIKTVSLSIEELVEHFDELNKNK